MGRLTTHVLDTAHGRPAAGMRVALWQLGQGGARRLLRQAATNGDGRLEAPLLAAEEMEAGAYELVFSVAAYFRGLGLVLPEPPFLDEVVLRFGVAEAGAHYHVPLLVSPYGYTTYRGS